MKNFWHGLILGISVMFFIAAIGGVGETPPTTVAIVNQDLTVADTEYDIDLPVNTRTVAFQARGANAVKCAFTDGASGTTYITIKANGSFAENTILYSGNLHCQSATAGEDLEVIYWTD